MNWKAGTRNKVIGILLFVLSFSACRSVGKTYDFLNIDIYHLCRPYEFDGYKNVGELFHISEPLRVRRIKGMITIRDWKGTWDEYWPVLYLRSLSKSQKTYEIRGDSTGRIFSRKLPQGSYCFLACASAPGYDGAYGIIIIDKRADPKNEIHIELPLGTPEPHP
jgi:hypothetical protein